MYGQIAQHALQVRTLYKALTSDQIKYQRTYYQGNLTNLKNNQGGTKSYQAIMNIFKSNKNMSK